MSEMNPQMMQMLIQAMMERGDGMGGLEQEQLGYKAMGPEGFKQHVGLGTLDERGALAQQQSQGNLQMVAQQLAEAQKFSEPRNQHNGSVAASIIGGIGDVAKAGFGGYQSAKLQGQQADLMKHGQANQLALLDRKDAGRLAAGNARAQAMEQFIAQQRAKQMQQPMGIQQQPGSGFGLPGLQFDPSLFGG